MLMRWTLGYFRWLGGLSVAALLAWASNARATELYDRLAEFEETPTVVQQVAARDEPVLGDLQWSTAGAETEPGSEEYPHIFSTDVWDPNRFWYTNRPNILNMPVDDNWDAMKIINTDRPDFTDVATVVGKGVLQSENGWSYRYHVDSGTAFARNTLPESLLRIGTSSRFEWRIKTDLGYTYTQVTDKATNQSQFLQGMSDTQLGFKYILVNQDDWIPLQTIVTRLEVPTGAAQYSANTVQPGITYIYNWQVRKWWFIRGSSGCDWLTSPNPVFGLPGQGIVSYQRNYNVQGFQSISSYFQIAPRVGIYVEWFALFHDHLADNRPDHYHNYGLYYYLTPNCQLDARIGWRFPGATEEWFTGAGLSFRVGPSGSGGSSSSSNGSNSNSMSSRSRRSR